MVNLQFYTYRQSRIMSMLNNVELALGVRLPPFPPSITIFTLFMINFILSLESKNSILFLTFVYFYGALMLFRQSTVYFYFKALLFVNVIVIWAFLNDILITKFQENVIFVGIILIFGKKIIQILMVIFKSYFWMKNMDFEDVFWIVQLGTFTQFLKYFADLKILRFAPSLLRLTQHLRVGKKWASYISALRYCFHFSRELMPAWSPQWIIFSIITNVWDIQNYYYNEFLIIRAVNGKGIFLYPKRFIICGFFIVICLQFSWSWAGKYATVLGVVRKILWNFLRIQCKTSDFYYKYAQLQIQKVQSEKKTL